MRFLHVLPLRGKFTPQLHPECPFLLGSLRSLPLRFHVQEIGDSGPGPGFEPLRMNGGGLLDRFLLSQSAADAAGAQIGTNADTTGQARRRRLTVWFYLDGQYVWRTVQCSFSANPPSIVQTETETAEWLRDVSTEAGQTNSVTTSVATKKWGFT